MKLLDLTHRFDAAATWAGLTAEQQAAIGEAALDLVALWNLEDQVFEGAEPNEALQKVAGTTDQFHDALQMAFADAIPREALETPSDQPRIPASLGMVCASCGCSETNACAEGCGWAAPNVCTACIHEPTGAAV